MAVLPPATIDVCRRLCVVHVVAGVLLFVLRVQALSPYQERLTDGAFDALVMHVATRLSKALEAAFVSRRFSALGAQVGCVSAVAVVHRTTAGASGRLQVCAAADGALKRCNGPSTSVRAIVLSPLLLLLLLCVYVRGCDGRDRFARLTQLTTLLTLDAVGEVAEVYGDGATGALAWRLTPQEVRRETRGGMGGRRCIGTVCVCASIGTKRSCSARRLRSRRHLAPALVVNVMPTSRATPDVVADGGRSVIPSRALELSFGKADTFLQCRKRAVSR